MTAVRHLGVIPDGGRRWARLNQVSLVESYRLSMKRLSQLAEAGFGNGLQELSIYLLSKANLKRPQSEIDAICLAILDLLTDLRRIDAAVVVAGDQTLLGEDLEHSLRSAARTSARGARVNLCIAYDPMDELRFAQMRAASGDLFAHLWVANPIDLVIRTGDAQTLSNFLPLQCAYARIVFHRELFNDLSLEQLMDDIRHHEGQKLLYGE